MPMYSATSLAVRKFFLSIDFSSLLMDFLRKIKCRAGFRLRTVSQMTVISVRFTRGFELQILRQEFILYSDGAVNPLCGWFGHPIGTREVPAPVYCRCFIFCIYYTLYVLIYQALIITKYMCSYMTLFVHIA